MYLLLQMFRYYQKYYVNGLRNDFILALSGLLKKNTSKKLDDALKIVETICDETNDDEKEARLELVKRTYSIEDDTKITGYNNLKDIIMNDKDFRLLTLMLGTKNIVKKDYDKIDNESSGEKASIILELYEKYNFVYIIETKEFLFYKDGIYQDFANELIEREVESMFPNLKKSKEIKEIVDAIKRQNHHSMNEFDKDVNILNLQNGLYNILTEELRPHDPTYLSRIQHPIVFEPNAESPKFEKFLSEIIDEENQRKILIYLAANTFYRNNTYPYIAILYGIGKNGKSVFVNLLSEMLGESNRSAVNLKNLMENRFSKVQLAQKNANFDSELTSLTIRDTAALKQLASDDLVYVEDKYKRGYSTHLYAKLWFNGNKMPDVKDDTDGWFRRTVPIIFPHQFSGENENTNLLNELIEEKNGIFNILRKALKEILTEQALDISIEEQKEKMQILSNPVEKFIEETCNIYLDGMTEVKWNEESQKFEEEPINIEDFIAVKSEIYTEYNEWCRRKNIPSKLDQKIFGRKIKNYLRQIEYFKNNLHGKIETQRRIDGKPVEVWIGIKMIPNSTDSQSNDDFAQDIEPKIAVKERFKKNN